MQPSVMELHRALRGVGVLQTSQLREAVRINSSQVQQHSTARKLWSPAGFPDLEAWKHRVRSQHALPWLGRSHLKV